MPFITLRLEGEEEEFPPSPLDKKIEFELARSAKHNAPGSLVTMSGAAKSGKATLDLRKQPGVPRGDNSLFVAGDGDFVEFIV